jgi:hypothetical protein
LRRRAQVRKLFSVAPQRKLRFSKAQLRSLHFKTLETTLIETFMTGFSMVQSVSISSYRAVVKSSAYYSEGPGSNLAKIRIHLINKVAVAFFALTIFFMKTCVLSINCCDAMRFK